MTDRLITAAELGDRLANVDVDRARPARGATGSGRRSQERASEHARHDGPESPAATEFRPELVQIGDVFCLRKPYPDRKWAAGWIACSDGIPTATTTIGQVRGA